jgi:hypothetical protein
MNVLEYFDYEKQLLRDYEAVKTPHAKTAVFTTLMDTLDTHREFVFNTISSFEENLKNARKDIQKAYSGQTPKYVTDMMAEFGFAEAEDVERGQEDCILDDATYNRLLGKTPAGPQPGSADEDQPAQKSQKKRRTRGKKPEAGKAQETPERKV